MRRRSVRPARSHMRAVRQIKRGSAGAPSDDSLQIDDFFPLATDGKSTYARKRALRRWRKEVVTSRARLYISAAL